MGCSLRSLGNVVSNFKKKQVVRPKNWMDRLNLPKS